VDEVVWGCLSNGYSDGREMYRLLVGASEEGELHLVMDANVSMPFTLLSYCFLFQENSWGTLPWHGHQWRQCYPQAFHRDEKVGS
jgi:hypothetical protein